ncbi:MAG TPA: phage holin family protein [Trebonia sp.]|nr:phage holin family protein [Trebonia sp.]
MVRIAGVRIPGGRAQSGNGAATPAPDSESLGDLVATAAKDVSQLIRYEIDLAKSELRADLRRAAMAGALFGFAAFVACLVMVLLTFALAYGLHSAGAPGGGGLYVDFVYAAVICVLVAVALAGIAVLGLKKFTKMRQTRKTVTADIGMLRAGIGQSANGSAGPAGSTESAGGSAGAVTDGRS